MPERPHHPVSSSPAVAGGDGAVRRLAPVDEAAPLPRAGAASPTCACVMPLTSGDTHLILLLRRKLANPLHLRPVHTPLASTPSFCLVGGSDNEARRALHRRSCWPALGWWEKKSAGDRQVKTDITDLLASYQLPFLTSILAKSHAPRQVPRMSTPLLLSGVLAPTAMRCGALGARIWPGRDVPNTACVRASAAQTCNAWAPTARSIIWSHPGQKKTPRQAGRLFTTTTLRTPGSHQLTSLLGRGEERDAFRVSIEISNR